MTEAAPEAESRALVVVRDVPEAVAVAAVRRLPRGAMIVAATEAAHQALIAHGLECHPPQDFGLGPHVRTQAREQIRLAAEHLAQDQSLTVERVPLGRLVWGPVFRTLTPMMTALHLADRIFARARPDEVLVPLAPSREAVMFSLDHLDGVTVSAESPATPCRPLWPPGSQLGRLLARSWRLWRALSTPRLLARSFLWPRVSAWGHPPPADIVLSPWSAAELASLRPVAGALLARRASAAAVESPAYYADRSARAHPDQTLPCYPLGRFSAAADWLAARRAAKAAARAVRGLIADGTLPGLLDPARSHLLARTGALRRLPIVLGWEAAYAHLTYAATRRCLEHLQARAVVVSKARGVEMESFVLAVADLRLPCLFLPHGLYADDPGWPRIPATLVAADGPHLVNVLTSRGHPPDSLAIVGPPKYDAALRALSAGRDALCRELGLDPAHRFVCVAATGDPRFARTACRALAAKAGDRGWQLLVKLHPRFTAPQYRQELLKASGGRARLVADADSLLVYAVSQAVVTGVSTSALEAMVAGVPVVYMGSLESESYGYAAEGAAAHAPNADGLATVVAEAVESAERRAQLIARGREFAARHFGGMDGRAAERCAQAALALADGASVPEVISLVSSPHEH